MAFPIMQVTFWTGSDWLLQLPCVYNSGDRKYLYFSASKHSNTHEKEAARQQFRRGCNFIITPLASLGAENGPEEDRLLFLLVFPICWPKERCQELMLPEGGGAQRGLAECTHSLFGSWHLWELKTKNCICRNVSLIISPGFLILNHWREMKAAI